MSITKRRRRKLMRGTVKTVTDAVAKPIIRRIRFFFITVFIVLFAGSSAAVAMDMHAYNEAAAAAVVVDARCATQNGESWTLTGDCGVSPDPTGVAGTVPMPGVPAGSGYTLFESFNINVWFLDTELDPALWNSNDWFPAILNALANMLVFLWVSLVYLAIGLSWWLFTLGDVAGLSTAIDSMIGTASGTLLQMILPAAIAAGGAVAFFHRQQNGPGSQFGQLAWVAGSALLGISLLVTPGLWTQGIDTVRNGGSDLVFETVDQAMTGNMTEPIPWPAVNFNGDARNNMMRKSADSMWRTLVVSPWCIANYGSMEACQQYAPDMLALGTYEARNLYIKEVVYHVESGSAGGWETGKASPTAQWLKGSNPAPRLGVVVLALVVALLFCVLLLFLAFAALAALLLSYLLLFCGVFFAALWCIPGRPRQWGIQWADALIGAVLGTVIAQLTFGATLVLLSAVFAIVGGAGWFVAAFMAIVLVFVAFGLLSQLRGIIGAVPTGAGRAALVGGFATRAVAKGLGNWTRGVGNNARRELTRHQNAAAGGRPLNPALQRSAPYAPPAGGAAPPGAGGRPPAPRGPSGGPQGGRGGGGRSGYSGYGVGRAGGRGGYPSAPGAAPAAGGVAPSAPTPSGAGGSRFGGQGPKPGGNTPPPTGAPTGRRMPAARSHTPGGLRPGPRRAR